MAAMNIDEMQPGLELDQLVAEKVMGWTATVAAFGADKGTLYRTDCTPYEDVPGFSVDIAAAWSVLEHIFDMTGRWICVEKSWSGGYFNAGVVGDIGDPDYWDWAASAETAPLAICRAAIKAVLGIDKT